MFNVENGIWIAFIKLHFCEPKKHVESHTCIFLLVTNKIEYFCSSFYKLKSVYVPFKTSSNFFGQALVAVWKLNNSRSYMCLSLVPIKNLF